MQLYQREFLNVKFRIFLRITVIKLHLTISPSLLSEYLSPPPLCCFQGPTGPPGSSGPPGSVGDPGERVSVSLDLIKTHYLSLLMYLYSTLSLNLSAHLSLSPFCRALLVKLVCPELTESLDLLEPQSCCL